MIDAIQKSLLEKVAELHDVPEGAYNIRANGKKAARVCYGVIALVFIAVGATQKVSLVWDMSDMFNGLMVIPNLLAVLALSNIVAKFAKDDHTLTGE